MKKSIVLFLFTFLFSNISNDSLAVLIMNSSTQILREVEYVDPLEGKKFGIELNPLYTILYNQFGPCYKKHKPDLERFHLLVRLVLPLLFPGP